MYFIECIEESLMKPTYMIACTALYGLLWNAAFLTFFHEAVLTICILQYSDSNNKPSYKTEQYNNPWLYILPFIFAFQNSNRHEKHLIFLFVNEGL